METKKILKMKPRGFFGWFRQLFNVWSIRDYDSVRRRYVNKTRPDYFIIDEAEVFEIRKIIDIVGGEPTQVGSFKKSSLASIKKLWSRLILQRYPVCCRCKCDRSVDPAHIYGRGIAPKLALHPLNGIGLCRRCHEICDHGPDRNEIYRVARSVMGQEKFNELSEARYKQAPSLEESEKLLLFHLK